MTLNIPPFLTLEHDQETMKATFQVEDASIKRQCAMWGMWNNHLLWLNRFS
jgi:large subunit ribosomal protein L6